MLIGDQPEENIMEQEEIEESDQEVQNNGEEQCMKISLQAMQADSVNTISILVHIEGKQDIALVDSGSNSTFMSL